MRLVILLMLVLLPASAWATVYYISPTGSDFNDGLSIGAPWQTYSKALGVSGMAGSPVGCGHTLMHLDGVYGDGTSTGKISISAKSCTAGAVLTLKALNERQARISDNGTGIAINLDTGTAYITLDGLVFNSTSNSGDTVHGSPFNGNNVNHITIKNCIARNPNKYANQSVILFNNAQDSLVVDTEIYDHHRHGILFFNSLRMTARRIYDHTRAGWLAGVTITGVTTQPAGESTATVSMYPCQNCVQENTISEGANYINEMNGSFGLNIPMSGSKILGSILIGGSHANGIYPNPRAVGANYSPTNILIEHNVFYNKPFAPCIRNTGGVNVSIKHITCIGSGAQPDPAFFNDDTTSGAPTTSFTLTDSIAMNWQTTGFYAGPTYTTWSGSNNFSFNNTTAYSPALPSNWSTPTASNTTNPGLGTCIAWTPAGSAANTAGAGATILYRYQDGVLTTTPLWDTTTGAFPHGAIVAGLNDTASTSLYNVHTRLNINSGGCPFPTGYGGSDTTPPAAPTNLRVM